MSNPAENQHGYMLIGLIFNVMFLGVMITQLYIYYTTYKRDRGWMKVYVAYLFLADTMNSLFVFIYIYQALVVHFGDFGKLFTADWIFAAGIATTAVTGTSVQLFFAWRVRIMTKKWGITSWALTAAVVATSLTAGISGIYSAWEASTHPKFEEFKNFNSVVSTWLAASAACDLLITSILVFALRKHKTGFQRSDLIIDRINRLIMQTGLLTMVVAVLDLVFFLTSTTGLHLVFNYTLSKLYTNSLMSTLNARHVTSNGSGAHTDTDGQGNTTSGPKANNGFNNNYRRETTDIVNLSRHPRPEVFVQVEEHELSDVKIGSMDDTSEKGAHSFAR